MRVRDSGGSGSEFLMRMQLSKPGLQSSEGAEKPCPGSLVTTDGGFNSSPHGPSTELLTHRMTFPIASGSREREVPRQKLQSLTPTIGNGLPSLLPNAADHTANLVQCGRNCKEVRLQKGEIIGGWLSKN